MAHRWQHTNPHSAATQARRRKYASREHRAAVAEYKRRQAAGEWLTCWRGRELIPPTLRVHVGHDDVDVNLIRGPECPRHNLEAAARKGNAVARGQRRGRRAVRTVRTVRQRDWFL